MSECLKQPFHFFLGWPKGQKSLKNLFKIYQYVVEGLFIPSLSLVMHVLCVAGIDHGDGIAVEGVGIVPLVGVCHVVTLLFPAA